MTKVYLGKDIETKEDIYLEKHERSCTWYWEFGHLGNNHRQYDFQDYLDSNSYCKDVIVHTKLTDDQWWVIRDLFIQAYSLKSTADCYRYGGSQKTVKGTTDIIFNIGKTKEMHKDVRIILDTLWEYLITECKLREIQ